MNRLPPPRPRNRRKRATAFFLTAALIFWVMPAPLSATATEAVPLLSEADISEATARLRRGLSNSAAAIDLSDCSLTSGELIRVYGGLLQDDPTLFYVAPRLSYSVSPVGEQTVGTVYPTYTLSGDALAGARAFYDTTVASLSAELASVLADHPHTEAEVALLIHDLLAARYDYDTRVFSDEGDGGANADAYTLFRDGVGVCQAYAMAAIALLRGAGLAADLVTSAAMDHAWVHVRVGASWYHMDVTRDDPVAVGSDGSALPAGVVTHTRVLRSDAGMRALGYSGYTCAGGHACTDARYESAAALAALGDLTAPLCALSTGTGAPLVWVGARADGALCALRLTEQGITVYAEGDVDGDGLVTPGDLLYLQNAALPATLREWVRKRVVESYSATRTDISPESNTESPRSVSTSRA